MASASKRLRLLEEIYQALPTVECKGLCHQYCAAVPAYEIELEQLENAAKRKLPLIQIETPGTAKIIGRRLEDPGCPLLVLNRCTVYDHRPFICRIFGVAQGMPCAHGCTPSRVLTDQEVIAIQRKLEKL